MTPINAAERDFIRHALGLSRQKVGYRNYYAAGGDDILIGRALVSKGMAVEWPPSSYRDGANFSITTAGFNAVKRKGESMDREETAVMERIDKNVKESTV